LFLGTNDKRFLRMAVSYMTVEGYKKLEKEIEFLETIERPKMSQQIADARDKGDLSENAEYDAAKEAQGMMEMKISQLKELFLNARILDESKINTDSVQILTTVTLFNHKTSQEIEYTIVSDSEANLKEKKISVSTPIAKGLLGKKVGDIAEITVPAGTLTLEIRKIGLAK
jgi:transcription elongation factor GreA